MATQPDPVQQLAGVINRLYDLSNNSNVTAAQQQQLTLQAHDLRGDLIELVTLQLNSTAPLYQSLMTNVASVTTGLNNAEQTIQDLVGEISGAAEVTAAINNVVQQAVQLAATAAKLAVA